MGCGVSSANASDSIVPNTMRANSQMTHNQHSPQPNQQPMDIRQRLIHFDEMEDQLQSVEETKCYVRLIMANEELERLNMQLRNLNDSNRRLEESIAKLIVSNQMNRDGLQQDLVINYWMRNADIDQDDLNMLQLLNEHELNIIKLKWVTEDVEYLNSESTNMQELNDHVQYLYRERDAILNQLFDGEYGSEKERSLELEQQSLLEEKNYAEITKMQWLNANERIVKAMACLNDGFEKLQQYLDIQDSDLNFKYTCIKEARINFCQFVYKMEPLFTILNVDLNHLTPEDLHELYERTLKLFEDSQKMDRFQGMIEFIKALHHKTNTQQKWIKKTMNSIIKDNVANIRERYHTNWHELRAERTVLIRQKIEHDQSESKHGSPIDLRGKYTNSFGANKTNIPNVQHRFPSVSMSRCVDHVSHFITLVDSGVESELGVRGDTLIRDEKIARLLASGKQSELSNGTPLLPGEELGPVPSDKEIFSKIAQLRNKHTQEMAEFEQNQRMIRVRMSQGLQDKLNNRRSRRSRQQMHRRELEALQESPLN